MLRDLTDVLRAAFAATLRDLDLRERTRRAISAWPRGRWTVIALGKSAAPMLAGLCDVRGADIVRAVVARPVRSPPAESDARMLEFASGHPVPDATSVLAGRAVLEAVAASGADATIVVLLSGGASSAACVPRDGVTIDDIALETRHMLASGADIETFNAARGRLDALKHGGLARAAGSRTVRTLVAVDVLGPPAVAARTVGSGPTLPREDRHDHFEILASPAHARDTVIAQLVARGLTVTPMDDASGSIEKLAPRYLRVMASLAPGCACVASGEPTVKLPEHPGRGGRAGRLALEIARRIRGEPVAFLACGSDGVDGESGHAGAVVDGTSWDAAIARGLDPHRALAEFDDGPLHAALGSAIDTGPTGVNLLDLHVLARLPAKSPRASFRA